MPPPATPTALELTLVLAATREMGIGRAGTLPWTGLKKEMAYFARVTKRLPPGTPSTAVNAVIMGRKTWDSIPPRFRPLKGRLNVVLSRSFGEPQSPPPPRADTGATANTEEADDPFVIRARSLPEALAHLRLRERRQQLGRVFVIGGAQVYDAALALPEARRILLTTVLTDFECDTFLKSLRLGGEEEDRGRDDGGDSESGPRWRRSPQEAFDSWAGEEVPVGVQEENGTSYEFQMWDKVD